jgi:hypothetical protein
MVFKDSPYSIILFLICTIIFTTLLGFVYDPYTIHEGFNLRLIFKAVGSLFTGMMQLGKIFVVFLDGLKKIPILIRFFIDGIFRFIPEFFVWLSSFAICTFTKILLIPQCGIWYVLDIFIYLIFTFMLFCFWVIDLITMQDTTGIFYYILDLAEEVDVMVYSIAGFHFMHYPDSVNRTCYSCETLPFPRKPKWPF